MVGLATVDCHQCVIIVRFDPPQPGVMKLILHVPGAVVVTWIGRVTLYCGGVALLIDKIFGPVNDPLVTVIEIVTVSFMAIVIGPDLPSQGLPLLKDGSVPNNSH